MNVAGPIRTRPLPLFADGKDVGSGSSSMNDVDMYLDVPSFELSLDEFEEYALARLKVGLSTIIIMICWWVMSIVIFCAWDCIFKSINDAVKFGVIYLFVGASDNENASSTPIAIPSNFISIVEQH